MLALCFAALAAAGPGRAGGTMPHPLGETVMLGDTGVVRILAVLLALGSSGGPGKSHYE